MTNRTLSLLAAFGISALLVACGGSSEAENNADTGTEAAQTETTQPAADMPAETAAPVADPNSPGTQDMAIGSEEAPLELIEYASVTCPACAAFHQNAYPRLKENYIDTGKVRLVFREFPTAPAQLSYLGSALARCAADTRGSNAYFAMLKTLFANQQKWVSDNYQSEILSYAAQAGLSEEAFRACVARDEIIGAINDNVASGREEYEVEGTPTFFLNGEKLEGYRTYDDIFALLDEALVEAGAEPPAAE